MSTPQETAGEQAGHSQLIARLLARAGAVMATARPFDPATSTRRFTVGAPDGVSAVVLSPLLAKLRDGAPKIDIAVRQLLPSPARVWRGALADLEAGAMDIAIVPSDDIPPRFERRRLYEEDFVIATRAGHRFARDPGLERYCELQHLVVSHSGDPRGFVDEALAKRGMSRRIALTVPNFMLAVAIVAETDLVTALPRRFAAMQAKRFGIRSVEPPVALPGFRVNAIAPKVALMDAGLAWLLGLLAGAEQVGAGHRKRPPSRRPG